MNTFLKNLGLILIILGAIVLVVCFFTGNVSNNTLLVTCAALVIVGIIVHIVLNKKIQD